MYFYLLNYLIGQIIHSSNNEVYVWIGLSQFMCGLGCLSLCVDWVVSVGTATRYRMGCQGIVSSLGRDFPHPSRPSLQPKQPSLKWIPRLFPGDKAAGAWRCPPTPITRQA